LVGGLIVGLGATTAAPADEKGGKPDSAAAKAAEDVRNIALASQLAEYGRQHKSPESLIAAARILRAIRTTPGTDKATVSEGKEEGDGKEAPSLLDQSDEMLKEAKHMAPDDSVIGQLIDRASRGKRGSVGGARSYFHRPGAGTVISHNVRFVAG